MIILDMEMATVSIAELNLSFHERINKYDYNSPICVIKECIENDISSTPTIGYRPLLLQKIKTELLSSRLNKFNDFKDNFNGTGISIHDISAQKNISFKFSKISYGLERYHSFHSTRPLWFGCD
ncbi:DUF3289 family protein [Escherichia coli]|nr:DUF3289 family protein [Escherichia coli]